MVDIIGEVKLWQSVILMAVNDSLYTINCDRKRLKTAENKYRTLEAKKAKEWLLSDVNNFNKVCNYANIDPYKLRKNVTDLFQIVHKDGAYHNNLIERQEVNLNTSCLLKEDSVFHDF